MMEERYHVTTQNRFYPDMSNVNKNITVEATCEPTYVTNSNQGGLQTALNKKLSDIISWFKAIFLTLNFNKMYYLQFSTENCIDTTLDIKLL